MKKRNFWLERKTGVQEVSYPASPEELKTVIRYLGTELPPLDVGRPVKVKYGVPVSAKLGPAHLTIMDRLIATRVLGPGIRSRAELMRAAAHWYLAHVTNLLRAAQMETLWAQAEEIKQEYYSLKLASEAKETGTLARLAAKTHIEMGHYDRARLSLWRARRFMAQLEAEEDRAVFDARICGGEYAVRPPGWETDGVAQAWDRVLAETVTPEGDDLEDDFVDPETARQLADYELHEEEEDDDAS